MLARVTSAARPATAPSATTTSTMASADPRRVQTCPTQHFYTRALRRVNLTTRTEAPPMPSTIAQTAEPRSVPVDEIEFGDPLGRSAYAVALQAPAAACLRVWGSETRFSSKSGGELVAAATDSPEPSVATDRMGRQDSFDRRPPDRLTDQFSSDGMDLAGPHRLSGTLKHGHHDLNHRNRPPRPTARHNRSGRRLGEKPSVQLREPPETGVMVCKGVRECPV